VELDKRREFFIKGANERHDVVGINVGAKEPQKVQFRRGGAHGVAPVMGLLVLLPGTILDVPHLTTSPPQSVSPPPSTSFSYNIQGTKSSWRFGNTVARPMMSLNPIHVKGSTK
jgi:hypothetical protein